MMLGLRSTHSELLVRIRESPGSPRVVLIGAAALVCQIPLGRETGDVDLAIAAEQPFFNAVLHGAGWSQDKHAKHRWRHDDGDSVVDVLPATARILQAGRVRLEGDDREMNMVGFDLALSSTIEGRLYDGTVVAVASLPALAMLKMVAWLDRPYDRVKDLGDLAHILDRSLDDDDPRRWEEPLADRDSDEQSPFFVGIQLGALIQARHREEIERFFVEIERRAWLATMAAQARWVGRDPEAIARQRLAAFRAGLG